jgi:hypothetical protein
MNSRYRPNTGSLLKEDLEALGLSTDKIIEIIVGKGVNTPLPSAEGVDPRQNLSLEEIKFLVGRGEKIDITFSRRLEGTIEKPEIKELFVLSFPSGACTEELNFGQAQDFLLENFKVELKESETVLRKVISYRRTTFWPHEGVHRARLEAEGKTYYV